MSGDWIKMTHALPEKPEVLAIAHKTGLNRFEVVGRLFIVWRWFDNNTVDGNAVSVTKVTLNECLFGYGDVTEFVSAMVDVHWLIESEDSLAVVKFDEHISESAKKRAQTANRVARHKKASLGNALTNAKVTHSALPDALPREEKRREEETPPTPKGEPEGFKTFWESWPKNDRKQSRGKCFEVWRKQKLEGISLEIHAHVESLKVSDTWTRQGGQFIPAPLVYLNQRRWEGAEVGQSSVSSLNLIGAI